MKLSNFRRILTSDYQEEFKALVEKLASSLNPGIEALYEAINNKKLSLRDNIYCAVKDVKVTVNASGVPITDIFVSKDNNNARVDGITVISAVNNVNSTTYPTSGVFVNYSPVETGISITHVTGLQANSEYTLR